MTEGYVADGRVPFSTPNIESTRRQPRGQMDQSKTSLAISGQTSLCSHPSDPNSTRLGASDLADAAWLFRSFRVWVCVQAREASKPKRLRAQFPALPLSASVTRPALSAVSAAAVNAPLSAQLQTDGAGMYILETYAVDRPSVGTDRRARVRNGVEGFSRIHTPVCGHGRVHRVCVCDRRVSIRSVFFCFHVARVHVLTARWRSQALHGTLQSRLIDRESSVNSATI